MPVDGMFSTQLSLRNSITTTAGTSTPAWLHSALRLRRGARSPWPATDDDTLACACLRIAITEGACARTRRRWQLVYIHSVLIERNSPICEAALARHTGMFIGICPRGSTAIL